MAQQQKQWECWRRVDARASIECHYGGAGCQASGQELSWKEERKIHLARERARETKSREMEDAELVFISVWGAGRSVDRPFCSVNDGGCRIKPKENQQKKNKKTIRLWAGSGSMSHDLQVREVAQTFIDPLTPAPFPSHVHTITWEESASSGTHVPFTALLFLTNIFIFFFTSMWCLGSYCVHHILPASSRRPPSLTSQHEVWTEGKSDEEEKLRPL